MTALTYRAPQTYRSYLTYRGTQSSALPSAYRATMTTLLRNVPTLLGERWYGRQRTNLTTIAVGTFSAPSSVMVVPSGRVTSEPYEDHSGQWKRKEQVQVRMSYVSPMWHVGDQFIDPSGSYWAVEDTAGDFITIRLTLGRVIPLKASPDRGSGV